MGIVAGVVSSKLAGKWYLLKAAVLGLLLESAALALVLVLVQPFELAVNIVSEVYVPMVAANTIGLVVWVYLLSKLRASENIGVV